MNSLSVTGAVMTAGGIGAVARYLLDDALTRRLRGDFPWGIAVVNVVGSFVIGVVAGLTLHHGLPEELRLIAATGFCGGFTTFSTASLDTVRLAYAGRRWQVVANTVGMVIATVAACALGLWLGS